LISERRKTNLIILGSIILSSAIFSLIIAETTTEKESYATNSGKSLDDYLKEQKENLEEGEHYIDDDPDLEEEGEK
jgi:hypothetical protein